MSHNERMIDMKEEKRSQKKTRQYKTIKEGGEKSEVEREKK